MTNRVELIPAHVWTCPECGTDQFERCVAVDMDQDGMEQIREDFGIEPGQDGVFLVAPREVTCDGCGKSYEAVGFQG